MVEAIGWPNALIFCNLGGRALLEGVFVGAGRKYMQSWRKGWENICTVGKLLHTTIAVNGNKNSRLRPL
jgi:hypothetical protein